MNTSELAPRDLLSVTPKDYLKNYLGNGNALRSRAPFCARPIKALGGAYMTPREIRCGKTWTLSEPEENLLQLLS